MSRIPQAQHRHYLPGLPNTPVSWGSRTGIILQMGKLALKSSICAKAPSQGSGTARNRMQVKITTINFFFFFLLLLNIFPAGSRSSSQNNFKEPKPLSLAHSKCDCLSPDTMDWAEGQGRLVDYRDHKKMPWMALSLWTSLPHFPAIFLGDSLLHLPTIWSLNLGILINQKSVYWWPTILRPRAVTE